MSLLDWWDETTIAALAAAVGAAITMARSLHIDWPRTLDASDGPHGWPTYSTGPPADHVPLEILTWLADPRQLKAAASNRDRVDLQKHLYEKGLDEPVRITIDQRGRATFSDGHHRLVAAGERNATHLRVVIDHSSVITEWGRPTRQLVERLLIGAPII